MTVVVVVVGTGAGSTGVEELPVNLVELFSGTLSVVVSFNKVTVDVRLTGTGTGTGTGPATTHLIRDFFIMSPTVLLMHPPLLTMFSFYPDDSSLPFYCLLSSALNE